MPKKRKEVSSPHPSVDEGATAPPNRRFYEILNIEQSATQADIEKAYKSLALKLHPDKNLSSGKQATEAFQQLQLAYTTLKDPKKRKCYDLHGCEDEETSEFMEAYEHYRLLFPQLQKQDIEEYAMKYKGSEEEVDDLINFYNRSNGDIQDLLEWIPLSHSDDIDRFINIYKELIAEKKISNKKAFKTSAVILEKGKKAWKKKENKEKKELDESQSDGMAELMLSIKGNQSKRSMQMAKLFEKIEEENSKKKKKKRSN